MGDVVSVLFTEDQVIDPDKVLGNAIGELTKVLVIGRHRDGSLYVASSHNKYHSAYLLMLAQKLLVDLSE